MASRLKEDEKNERNIRSLLKLPENRRCINCNSLGPQYVCTNFWTFVCTTCSGIHREFTHRVKSISMAKFTSQEVSAIQGGGNASAKEIYLKEWGAQRNSLPDASNVERLRDFIKHVYVDKRYTGERNFDKPPSGKMGQMEDSGENRRLDAAYQGGSRSPPYEDTFERRYSNRSSPGGRSPSYGQDNLQQVDNKRSPARSEVINDWRREDRFGNGSKSEDKISDGRSKPEARSPDRQKTPEMTSPPVVRPVREILGENVTPLRVIEPPRAYSVRSTDDSVHPQRTASSNSLASSNANPAEIKMETSLIDFEAVPEPPSIAPAPQPWQHPTGKSIPEQTVSSVADNWANFDSVTEAKVVQAPSNANQLESVLSELSIPASLPSNSGGTSVSGGNFIAGTASNLWDFPSGSSSAASVVSPFSGFPATPPIIQSMTTPAGGASGVAPLAPTSQVPVGASTPYVNAANKEQWTNMQPQQPFAFPGSGNVTVPQPFTLAAGGVPSNQPWNPLVAPNSQGLPRAPVVQSLSLASTNPAFVSTPGVTTNPSAGGRRELPEDFFAAPVLGWHTGPPHGFGFNMQYRMQMPMPTSLQRSKSANPFDVSNEQPPVQALTFPSMASMQGALPNMAAPTGLMRTSSLGTHSSTLMVPDPSHPFAVPPQASPYPSAVLPGSYLGQQVPSNIPLRPQGAAGFPLEGSAFGSLNSNQQLGGLYSAPATQNTFTSVGGNPFG